MAPRRPVLTGVPATSRNLPSTLAPASTMAAREVRRFGPHVRTCGGKITGRPSAKGVIRDATRTGCSLLVLLGEVQTEARVAGSRCPGRGGTVRPHHERRVA